MKLEDLTAKHLVEIVRLYELYCGRRREFREAIYSEPSSVLAHLKKNGGQDYRAGSRWHCQSKLFFETDSEGNFSVRFDSNFDSRYRDKKAIMEADKAGDTFAKMAMQYLGNQKP